MKGITAIIDRINKEAERESRAILKEAETERDKILGEAQERASLIIKEAEARAKELAKERESQLEAHLRLEVKRKELAYKNKALEEVYSRAEDELKKFVKSAKYKSYMKSLLESLKPKPRLVHVRKSDVSLIKSVKAVGDLPEDAIGGLVADFGDYELDLTLRSKLEDEFNDKRAEIFKRLV